MLRVFVLVAAMVAFTVALIVVAFVPPEWPLLVWTGLILAGILFERGRYGAARARPVGGRWRETPERFVDPASGQSMAVWFDPDTGARQYVALKQTDIASANELQ